MPKYAIQNYVDADVYFFLQRIQLANINTKTICYQNP